jgi:diamine N-acetyltransferase
MNPTLRLESVTRQNWREIIELRVHPEQKTFVAENAISLLQAHYHPDYEALPYGIYSGDTLIGFVMTFHLDRVAEPRTIWIMRYMIGSQHQGQGLGKIALRYVLDVLRQNGTYDTVKLSYVPENHVAQKLYASLGFVEEGLNPEWGEIIARYTFQP